MKKIVSFFYTLVFILIFTACTGDEVNQDCYTCTSTLTEYCIVEGDDFYTISVNGETAQNISLDDEFWADIRVALEEECEDSELVEDCFTCDDTQTEYCYLEGDDFYTSEITGENETQIPLNNNTWEEVKTDLVNNCQGEITASIVGNWKITEFQGTTNVITTTLGTPVTVISVQQAITYEAFVEFTESPNEFIGSGFMTVEYTIDGVTEEYTTSPYENGTWEINENIITTVQDEVSTDTTILELTETTLRMRYFYISTIVSGDTSTETTLEFFYTYERQ